MPIESDAALHKPAANRSTKTKLMNQETKHACVLVYEAKAGLERERESKMFLK